MKIIEEIAGLVSGKLDVFKTIVSIIRLETRLAGLSVYPLLLNVCMLLIVLMAMWLSTLLLVGYLALLTFDSTIAAIIFILLLNGGLFLGLLKYLTFNLKKMSFEKTRKYVFNTESNHDDEQKTTSHCKNRDDGKNITLPTS